MHHPRQGHPLKGFTLIEMLVVIAVLSVLMLLMIMGFRNYHERGLVLGCQINLRNLGSALLLYAGDHEGSFPYLTQEGSNGKPIAQPYWNSPLSLARLVDYGYLERDAKTRWSESMHCPADPNRDFWMKDKGYSLSYIYRQSDTSSGSAGGGEPIQPGMTREGPSIALRWVVIDRWGAGGSFPEKPYPGGSLSIRDRIGEPPPGIGKSDGSSYSSYWHRGGANVLYEDGSVRWRSFPDESAGIY